MREVVGKGKKKILTKIIFHVWFLWKIWKKKSNIIKIFRNYVFLNYLISILKNKNKCNEFEETCKNKLLTLNLYFILFYFFFPFVFPFYFLSYAFSFCLSKHPILIKIDCFETSNAFQEWSRVTHVGSWHFSTCFI